MPFTPKDWKDSPEITTPITSTGLKNMETRLSDYIDTREVVIRSDFATADTATLSSAQTYTNDQITALGEENSNKFKYTLNWMVPSYISDYEILLPQYVAVKSGTSLKMVGVHTMMKDLGSGNALVIDLHVGGAGRAGGQTMASTNRVVSGFFATAAGGAIGGSPDLSTLNFTLSHGQWIGFVVISNAGGIPANMTIAVNLELTLYSQLVEPL